MAIEVTHKFQSQKPDSPDASLIRPSNWNETHNISLDGSRLIGRAATSRGAAQEILLGGGLKFDGTSLVLDIEDELEGKQDKLTLATKAQAQNPGDTALRGWSAQRIHEAAQSVDPWALQPIGVPIPMYGGGNLLPNNTGNPYKYIMLTSGRSDYNGSMLTGETISGSAPLVQATAKINLSGSPMNGRTVRLLNNEGRFLRAGYESQIGNVQNDSVQNITGDFSARNTHGGGVVIYQGGGAFRVTNSSESNTTVDANSWNQPLREITFDASRVARTSNETRPKNMTVCYIMRIL